MGVRDTLAHKARLFLDGALGIEVTDTTTGPITSAQTQTWMGRRYPCPVPNQFTGTLDELAVYRKVLSADRIQEHYQLGRAPVAQDPDSQATFSIDLAGAFGWLTQDPVQTSTGNYAYRHTDVSIAGRGPSPTFERAYNSVATRVSALGKGWTFNYNAHLADAGDGTGALILVSPEGGSNRYTPAGNNTYTPPPGITTSLVLNQTNPATFTATLQDQTQWTFDNQGRLTAIKDRYGNVSTLTYDATSGRLTLVSDPASRGSLGFRYDTFTGGITSYTIAGGRTMACQTGRLCEVSDWSGRTIQYGYDASGRLTDVIDREQMSHPAAQRISTQYTYDGTTSHLTTITDANGHAAVTMTYDAQGRVASQKDALGLSTGQQTTFGPYGAAATCPAGATPPCTATTVTYPQSSFDAKAMTVVDTYDANGFLVRRVSTPSNVAGETYTESYTYATNGFRSSVTDPNGKTTTFCYDTGYNGQAISGSLGNLTRRIDPPVGANPPTVTLFKYDAKNNLIETVSPKGVSNGTTVTCSTDLSGAVNTSGLYITDMAYDATGAQLLSTTRKYIDPDLAGTQTATTKFEYGDAANPSRVTRTIPPRGNTGATPDYTYATTLAYFGSGSQAGMLQSATDPLGNQTTYTYDAVGRKLSMVDPNGNAAGGVPADHTWTFG